MSQLLLLTLLGLLAVLALLGAPLFAVILAVAMLGFFHNGIDLSVIAIELYRVADTPLLIALPLFTFAGYLLSASRASHRLVRVTRALLGWMPGGFALICLLACALFTALTGASGVTIVALGALLYPALVDSGYPEHFSLGLVTTSGSLGLLLPPSLPLILYAILSQQLDIGANVRIEELFVAGLLPCLLMIGLLGGWCLWSQRAHPAPTIAFNAREAGLAIKEAIWEIPLPIFLFGGIYSGVFALSEAAAITALYLLIVETLVYREIAWNRLTTVMGEAMVMSGSILLILGVSLALTSYLVDAEIPALLFSWTQDHIHDKYSFLILLNLILLALGAILDIFAALVIMIPLILPLALGYGVDPVHLGIIFLANMQIGYFTPPVGINLFIASYRFKRPVLEIYHATIPFFLVLLSALLLITYIPALSLGLLGR